MNECDASLNITVLIHRIVAGTYSYDVVLAVMGTLSKNTHTKAKSFSPKYKEKRQPPNKEWINSKSSHASMPCHWTKKENAYKY
jgi:hypothetical protein